MLPQKDIHAGGLIFNCEPEIGKTVIKITDPVAKCTISLDSSKIATSSGLTPLMFKNMLQGFGRQI